MILRKPHRQIYSVRDVLDFSRLQPDLLPRIAARDNNVGCFAGTSLDATRFALALSLSRKSDCRHFSRLK